MSMLNAGGNFLSTMNISVDEGMIGFHGSLSFRQYKPAKPIKYGIKIWMTADSSNGFVLNFDVLEVGISETDGTQTNFAQGPTILTVHFRKRGVEVEK